MRRGGAGIYACGLASTSPGFSRWGKNIRVHQFRNCFRPFSMLLYPQRSTSAAEAEIETAYTAGINACSTLSQDTAARKPYALR
jgi:hypothetical protein